MEAATAVSTDDPPERLLDRVQELQGRLESASDPATLELSDALVAAVVQMYGAGLARILERLQASGELGEVFARGLTEEPLVSTLLLIHDLHPVALEDRVQGALDSVRPYMQSHGGSVELLSIENGVARLHLRGSCSDCSASAVTLELAIKQALEEAAPDLEGLEVEGMTAQTAGEGTLPMATGSAPTGMELPIMTVPAPAGPELPVAKPTVPSWFDVDLGNPITEGALTAIEVAGQGLVIANVDGTLLAYRDVCASCHEPLRDGRLQAGALRCESCERSFFLPRAGRSLDEDGLQLEPVPLLREGDQVRVALAT